MRQLVILVGVVARHEGKWLGHCVLCQMGDRKWVARQATEGGWHGTVAQEVRRLAALAQQKGVEVEFVVNSFRALHQLKAEGYNVRKASEKEAEQMKALFAEAKSRITAPEGAEWFPTEW
ncbi:MAG: hypothetical protein KatS3mg023_3862 [Armatimonadota bacterium]|nr:MAG: hypothetical protein KatS3mg023_3862 [Armatimonadota bacterium]